MNRLVLVGNGFDLAHGMKTKYSDFILGYLKSCVLKSMEMEEDNHTYKDPLLHMICHVHTINKDIVITKLNAIKTLEELFGNNHGSIIKFNLYNDESYEKEFLCKIYSPFFKELLKKFREINCNWVDIEKFYYQHLLDHFKNLKTPIIQDNDDYLSKIIDLNIHMDHISLKLSEYLNKQKFPYSSGIMAPQYELFKKIQEPLSEKEYTAIGVYPVPESIKNVMVLDFNYTSTFSEYLKIHSDSKLKYLQIHGQLNDSKNLIILGYGDDTHSHYSLLENEDNDELLRNIKSFRYAKNYNYHNFLNFIESGDFDVFIVGHSCGMSDRTMLRTIFSHDKCKGIKIFFKEGADDKLKEDEYFYKGIAISRHFVDKEIMRKKIIPYSEWDSIPQNINNQLV